MMRLKFFEFHFLKKCEVFGVKAGVKVILPP